jgi:hypothetical protein
MLRVYRSLLYLYPADYRHEFGDEMECVFLQAEADVAGRARLSRASFRIREVSGLLSGAVQGHLRRLFGFHESHPLRRLNMRPQFRFPRSTVFMMFVILAGVLLAIEKAKTIQLKYGPQEVMAIWNSLPWFLFLFPAMACAVVAAGWGILFALRRSGMHRLANVQTWPEQG